MHNFHLTHPVSKAYCPKEAFPGCRSFHNSDGWTDYWLGDHMVYSHRKTDFSFSNFPDRLHSHSAYELNLLRRGDVTLIADSHTVQISPGTLFIARPGCIHTTQLLSETTYERYIFYLDEHAFDFIGGSALLRFLHTKDYTLSFPLELEDSIYSTLHRLDRALADNSAESVGLAYSYLIQLFYLFNRHAISNTQGIQAIPQNALQIKRYVDENYITLNTTAEIAEHFFYRREYVSRVFKEYFGTNLSDYLSMLKIRHSKDLLKAGVSVTDACYKSGFRNMSTFASAFRNQVHMNPSSYRKAQKKT